MTFRELIDRITAALAVDEDITAWAETHFERLHNVLVGVDELNPPADDLYPVIALLSVSVSYQPRNLIRRYQLEIAAGVVCPDRPESGALSNVLEYSGLILARELIELTESCLLRLRLPGLQFTGQIADFNAKDMFVAATLVDIDLPAASRVR